MKLIITESQYERLIQMVETNAEDNSETKPKKVKDDTAKFLKCKNCKKWFTQTIHKGKKSLPICPWCKTHNNEHK